MPPWLCLLPILPIMLWLPLLLGSTHPPLRTPLLLMLQQLCWCSRAHDQHRGAIGS